MEVWLDFEMAGFVSGIYFVLGFDFELGPDSDLGFEIDFVVELELGSVIESDSQPVVVLG